MAAKRDEELKDSNYELFILVLSLLSVFNWALFFFPLDENTRELIIDVNLVLSLIFLGDFLYRLYSAASKRGYFVKQFGWLDLLSSLPLPQAKIFRLGRVIRSLRLMRRRGLRGVIAEFISDRAETAVYIVAFLIILVLEFGSLAVLVAEKGASGSNITTAGDALWWSIVTISTVGYGDQYPVSAQGRLVGIFVILVGVALFGVVTGFLANRFTGGGDDTAREEGAQPSPGSDAQAPVLAEIAKLQAEQERAYGEINARLDELFARLERQGQ